MKTSMRLVSIALVLVAATAAHAGGSANFFLGQRDLSDEGFWKQQGVDLASPTALGAEVAFTGHDWPVDLVVALHLSADSDQTTFGNDVTAAVGDVGFGVNWPILRHGSVRPYVGGGVAAVGVAIDIEDDDDDADQSFGFWAHGGVLFRLGSRFNVGFDARFLRGTDFTLFGTDFDADYDQYSAFFGFNW